MAPNPTSTGLFPVSKDKKSTREATCNAATPTHSLRRAVKPLGEHNRSRSHSPAFDAPSLKDKRTPRAQKTMLPGVDLSRRFAESIHGPCTLATNRGVVDVRSPRGSLTLDRIHEGCPSSIRREKKTSGTAVKTRLRGADDTPPVKKAIAFTTPSGNDSTVKDSIRKHNKLVKRKDLIEHFILEGKKESSPKPASAPSLLSSKSFSDRHAARNGDIASRNLKSTQTNDLEGQGKCAVLRSLSLPKGIEFAGKVSGSDVSPLVRSPGPKNSFHVTMAMSRRSSRNTEEKSSTKDASCQSDIDSTELSPPRSEALCDRNLGIVFRKDGPSGRAASSSLEDGLCEKESIHTTNITNTDTCGEVMLSTLPFRPLEVNNGEPAMGESSPSWDLQEGNVAEEWFCSRDSVSSFVSLIKSSKAPDPHLSKSPELSNRAVGLGSVAGALTGTTGKERQQDASDQQTPPPQVTNSPEFLKRGSVPPAGGCFGAGPLMGPEGMGTVKDRRKCKPRGILTIEGEFLCSSGSAEFLDEEMHRKETISVPALASVEWMVAEGYDIDSAHHPESKNSTYVSARDIDASLRVSRGSFSRLVECGERASSVYCHRRSRSAADLSANQVYWKKGLLYEWNLSMLDQKRAESSSPTTEEEETVSPRGKLCDFSLPLSRLSDATGNSLVIGALGSVIGTPPSCRAPDCDAEYKENSKCEENRDVEIVGHRVVPSEQALQGFPLDGRPVSLSLSISVGLSPDSSQSWQDMQSSESSRWSNASSNGEWDDYLSNLRHRGFSNQFRLHLTKEMYAPTTKAEICSRPAPRKASPPYSDEGDCVVSAPNSVVTPPSSICKPFDWDSWKKSVRKSAKDVEVLRKSGCISTTPSVLRDREPDLLGISISVNGSPFS